MTRPVLFDAVREAAEHRSTAITTRDGTHTFLDLLSASERYAYTLPDGPVSLRVHGPVAAAVVLLACDLVGTPVVHESPETVHPAVGATVTDVPVAGARAWKASDTLSLWTSPAPEGDVPGKLPERTHTFRTSGSTGPPTGVVRTAEAVLADGRRVAAFLDYGAQSPVTVCAPLFHVYAFNYGLVGTLTSGTPTSYLPTRSVPSQLARGVREHRSRTLIALSAHYRMLASSPDLVQSTLRRAVSAGAPLAEGVADVVREKNTFTLFNCYGSSEAGAVTLAPALADTALVGDPLPGIRTRLDRVDEGEELLLKTDSLAAGRLGPDGFLTLETDRGWYRTGDLARSTAAGIRIVGRRGNVINVGGKKVDPSEIESVLRGHPAVSEVQVLAEAHHAYGHVPVARAVAKDTASVEELVGWCREHLEAHQVPRRIDLVPELPRSATGKILRDVHRQ